MALPVAAIVCIVLACWAVVVLAIFGLYHLLKRRGICSCECKPCGTEGGESCTCCKSASEACNCCNPSLNGCLDSVCPKKKCSCVDIILCQCCSEPGQDSCLVNIFPCCKHDSDLCGDNCCPSDKVVCCCLEIRLAAKSDTESGAKYTPSTQHIISDGSNKNDSNEKQMSILDRTSLRKGASKTAKTHKKPLPSAISSSVRSNSPPQTPTTARSTNQLLPYHDESTKQKKTSKSSKRMKSPRYPITTANSNASTTSASTTNQNTGKMNTRSQPVPPSSRSLSARSDSLSGEKKKSSASAVTELKEVPVKQLVSLSHSHLYENSHFSHSGQDLMLGLPQHYDLMSQTVSLDGSFNSGPLSWSHGTILDGSGTHRSTAVGSSLSVHFEVEGEGSEGMALTSSRPLPGPPMRCDCPCAPFVVKDNNGQLCEWARFKLSKCTTGISDCVKCNSQSSNDCMTCAKCKVTCLSACKTCKCCDFDTDGSTWPIYEIRVSRRLRGIYRSSSCPEHFLCFEFNETEAVNCFCHYFGCNRCGDPLFVYLGENDICYYQDSNCLVFMIQNVFKSVGCLCLGCFGLLGNSINCCISSCALCARISCCRCGNDMCCTDFSCCCFDFHKVKRNLDCGHGDVASKHGENVEHMDGKCICCVYRSGIDLSTLNYEIKIESPLQILPQDSGDIQVVQPQSLSNPKLQRKEVKENCPLSSEYNLQKSKMQACELMDERTISKTVGRTNSKKKQKKKAISDPGFSKPSGNKHTSASLDMNSDDSNEQSLQNNSVQQDLSSSSESDYDYTAIYKRRIKSHTRDRAKSGRKQKHTSDLHPSQKLTAPPSYGNISDSDDIAVNGSERENQSFIDRKRMHQLQEKLLQQPTDSDFKTSVSAYKNGQKHKKRKQHSFPIEDYENKSDTLLSKVHRESANNSDEEQKQIIGILKNNSRYFGTDSVTDRPRKITRFTDEELIKELFPVRSDGNVKQEVLFRKGTVHDYPERYVKSGSGLSGTNYNSTDSDTERSASVKKGGQTSWRAAERSASLEKGGQTSRKAAERSDSLEKGGQTSRKAAERSTSLEKGGQTSLRAAERSASLEKGGQTSRKAAEISASLEKGGQTSLRAAERSASLEKGGQTSRKAAERSASLEKGGQTSQRAAERSASLEKGGQTSRKAAERSASLEKGGQTSQRAAERSASLEKGGQTSWKAAERSASLEKGGQTSLWAAERSTCANKEGQISHSAISQAEEDSVKTKRKKKRHKLETSAGKSLLLKDADDSTDFDASYTSPSKDQRKRKKSDQIAKQNKKSGVKIGWESDEDSVEMINENTDQKIERRIQKFTGEGQEDKDSDNMRRPDGRTVGQRMAELRKKWLQEDSD